MGELSNRVAIVTGGARDIGRATSLKLAELGASVVVNYFDNPADAEETVTLITSKGGKATAVQGNVMKQEDIDRIVKTSLDTFGPKINILINVAGGLVGRKTVPEMDESFWDFVIGLNLKSVFLMTKAVLPHMAEGGTIVNFASQAARDGGGPGASAYSASKAGVLNFTRSMAKELGSKKIRVNSVSPGMINTTFHNTFTKDEVRQKVASMTPLGREGEAPEVAELVAFLASDRSSFINGESVEINGGIFFS
ncbi:MAG: glucose 1-dehydrogenase [Bacteroidota bacterium]|jgi:3-oxoacyl-[acyl-carrier protein] reductase